MARALYSLLLRLAAPLILLRLLWRARRQPDYLAHWGERWGFYGGADAFAARFAGRGFWLHAVSVGEMRAAHPLITRLRQRYPETPLLISCMTPTGRAVAEQLYGHADPERLAIVYLPYDTPGAMRRFWRRFRPRLGILLETEIWPNLMAAATAPVILANARLSRQSARRYSHVIKLMRPALARLALVAAQTEADANRLARLGATRLSVSGNLKFDMTPDPDLLALGEDWRNRLGGRPVWLAASTRDGEEILLLDAYRRLRRPDLLFVIVPRHPQRFDAVARLVSERGFRMQRRSQGLPDAQTQVWLGDSMGELAAYYRLADCAFIGGSLLPLGGQNLIEAAACGCPTLIGPHTFNFARASQDAIAAGAALRVYMPEDLAVAVRRLLESPAKRQRMRTDALAFAKRHQGACERTLTLLEQVLTRERPTTGASDSGNPAI